MFGHFTMNGEKFQSHKNEHVNISEDVRQVEREKMRAFMKQIINHYFLVYHADVSSVTTVLLGGRT